MMMVLVAFVSYSSKLLHQLSSRSMPSSSGDYAGACCTVRDLCPGTIGRENCPGWISFVGSLVGCWLAVKRRDAYYSAGTWLQSLVQVRSVLQYSASEASTLSDCNATLIVTQSQAAGCLKLYDVGAALEWRSIRVNQRYNGALKSTNTVSDRDRMMAWGWWTLPATGGLTWSYSILAHIGFCCITDCVELQQFKS